MECLRLMNNYIILTSHRSQTINSLLTIRREVILTSGLFDDDETLSRTSFLKLWNRCFHHVKIREYKLSQESVPFVRYLLIYDVERKKERHCY